MANYASSGRPESVPCLSTGVLGTTMMLMHMANYASSESQKECLVGQLMLMQLANCASSARSTDADARGKLCQQ